MTNAYQEKDSVFECGFHSFLGQNRTQFNISFFIFGLLFLLFDLEILLVYPYSVSSYTNDIYGLIIMMLFFVLLTLGFIFELGKNALTIDSKQTSISNNKNTSNIYVFTGTLKSVIPFNSLLNMVLKSTTPKDNKNKPGLYSQCGKTSGKFPGHCLAQPRCIRLYSTKNSNDFWGKVKSLDEKTVDNPFIIVNNILKKYPSKELVRGKINLSIINSILSKSLHNSGLTQKEFDILIQIKAIKFDLPIKDKSAFSDVVGKYVRNGARGIAGAYIFTNKENGNCYVGSSISLASRLATGYFVPVLGKRKIDLAIKDLGLSLFYLDILILPAELIVEKTVDGEDTMISLLRLKNLTLALEQILLLEYNPEYNVLKVAGSPAGLKRTAQSMLPSFTKNSKPVYLYDNLKKELIYTSKSLTELAGILKITVSNLGTCITNSTLYLNQFLFSKIIIENEKYVTNFMDKDSLFSYIAGIRTARKKDIMKQVDSTRLARVLKESRGIELTNLETNEVLVFKSISDTARYLRGLNPDYKCSPGTVSDYSSRGIIYKGLFKIKMKKSNFLLSLRKTLLVFLLLVALLAFCLVIQRITGVTLAMHYNPSVTEAFNSVYSLDANFINCDAPRAWGLYFQDSASPQMEALVKLYGDIMFYLEAIGFTATSIIGTIEPGIDIDLGNQVSLYATIFLLLLVSELFRRIHKPKLHIQCEIVRVKDGNTSKLCLIDLNDRRGHNLWLYYHLSSDVTRHSVRWNGKTWYAVMSKTFPPSMSPNGLSPIVHDYLYSRFVHNDSIDLYAPILEVVFPGPNMVQYGLLCQAYNVKTFNGLHNHRTEFLPMNLVLGTVNTGHAILPLKLYKWTMQIEEGNVLRNC